MTESVHLYLATTYSFLVTHAVSRVQVARTTASVHNNTFLLPTSGTIQDLRPQLGDTMNVGTYQFYSQARNILDQAAIPVHELNDIAIRRLIRKILAAMQAEGALTTFADVSTKLGFLDVILDWLREMKSQGIRPEAYTAYAKRSGLERDRQLAELYERYQAFLRERNYSDPDGLLWLTAEALEEDPTLYQSDGACFVLGFDQFSPVQIRILAQLAERFDDFAIYLLWDPPARKRAWRFRACKKLGPRWKRPYL